MTRIHSIAVMAAVLLVFSPPAPAGEIIDRIVATANRDAILQSDWDDAVHYEAFVGGRPLDHVTNQDRKAALDRLIDQVLLRGQIQLAQASPAKQEEVEKRVAEIRAQYAGADTPEGWQAALQRYGLTEAVLKQRVAEQIEIMQLVEARLRPSVTIDSKSIESYYNQELLPQLRQSGAQDVPLAEVTPQIKELLTEQKVSRLLTAWLQNLRAGSEIHTEIPSQDSQGQAQ
jgi:hypothetical protein